MGLFCWTHKFIMIVPKIKKNDKLLHDISSLMFQRYPIFRMKASYEDIFNLADRWFDKMIISRNENGLTGVAFYMMLNDEAIEDIRTLKYNVNNADSFLNLMNQPGDNLFFFGLTVGRLSVLMRALREIISWRKPKTVSWLKPDMKKFVLINLEKRKED